MVPEQLRAQMLAVECSPEIAATNTSTYALVSGMKLRRHL